MTNTKYMTESQKHFDRKIENDVKLIIIYLAKQRKT